jgi:hypothetical protein
VKGIHWINTGQWPQAMAITGDADAYRRFMRKYCGKEHENDPPFPRFNGGLCQKLEDDVGNVIMFIAVGKQKDRAELACTLAHEATHAMRWMLEHVREKEPGTETEAYLVEHIVRHGLRALTRTR